MCVFVVGACVAVAVGSVESAKTSVVVIRVVDIRRGNMLCI